MALAAIQGLYQRQQRVIAQVRSHNSALDAQGAEIRALRAIVEELRAQNTALQERLTALEQRAH